MLGSCGASAHGERDPLAFSEEELAKATGSRVGDLGSDRPTLAQAAPICARKCEVGLRSVMKERPRRLHEGKSCRRGRVGTQSRPDPYTDIAASNNLLVLS